LSNVRFLERVFDRRVGIPADDVKRAKRPAEPAFREVRWRGLEPPRPFKATRPST
jgi:hypothetical protein